MKPIHDLRVFVESLRQKPEQEKYDVIANTVIESGGVWLLPIPKFVKSYRGICEIRLFEIGSIGLKPSEAINDWIKCATRFLLEHDAKISAT